MSRFNQVDLCLVELRLTQKPYLDQEKGKGSVWVTILQVGLPTSLLTCVLAWLRLRYRYKQNTEITNAALKDIKSAKDRAEVIKALTPMIEAMNKGDGLPRLRQQQTPPPL